MDRRRFLREGVAGGVIAVGAGGFMFARRSDARAEMNSRLLADSMPPLANSSLRQLQTLPARGREEIRLYFDGKCLNVQSFISHICSDHFRERLSRCSTNDERHVCMLAAFCGKVAPEAEIIHKIDTIATDVGSELDNDWSEYCRELSVKWNVRIKSYGSPFTADALNSRVSPDISSLLRKWSSAAA